ncbi:hypothetical protein PoB_001510200 [Plakobranchus ocellatus]|uniref:Uncharacterized protein n=1 Tax=Plakobranchus ocellatus TaxID=259542 RepID=A0AAV3Z278_9GAST|nr:hypothetical protein PoB_001510200 [Plakobranchus ocellatus]
MLDEKISRSDSGSRLNSRQPISSHHRKVLCVHGHQCLKSRPIKNSAQHSSSTRSLCRLKRTHPCFSKLCCSEYSPFLPLSTTPASCGAEIDHLGAGTGTSSRWPLGCLCLTGRSLAIFGSGPSHACAESMLQ